MSNESAAIIWEKWVDPYGENLDDIEWPGFDKENILTDSPNDEESVDKEYTKPIKINAMITSMGIIPYNEHTDCSKIFNFWIGHTNFTINKFVADLLEGVDGVETLDIFTRYRFRISFGKAFNERSIIDNINNIILEKIKL